MANTSCLYYKQRRYVSYNNGATWQPLNEYRKGELYEYDSSDCGYYTMYQWVSVSGEYICDGTTKYQKEKKQVSTDGGQTWSDVTPLETRKGFVIEYNSEDCGYVPPTPTGGTKFYATYSDSTTYGVICNSSTTLTLSEVRGSSLPYSSMTSADIGGCVTRIDASAFTDCIGLTSIIIPSGVSTIGGNAFFRCSGITSITINDGVTTIGTDAFRLTNISSVIIPNSVTHFDGFMQCYNLTNIIIGTSVSTFGVMALYNCTSLESITINATTPPTLTSYSLYNTNNCPIYVPAQSVQAYKEASVWSDYASRIQAIPTS